MYSIECKDTILSISTHFNKWLACIGLINGTAELWEIPKKGQTVSLKKLPIIQIKPPKFYSCELFISCRVVEFSIFCDSSDLIALGYSNGHIQVVDCEGKVLWISKYSNKHGITSIEWISERMLISGDEKGILHVWNVSKKHKNFLFKDNHMDDYTSDMRYDPSTHNLLVTCGNGKMYVYNFSESSNELRLKSVSNQQDSDLKSIQIVCNGKKVVVGTLEGILGIWSWNKWEDTSDRIKGHVEPIECILKLSEKTILTGSTDGLIRVIHLFPNKFLGILADLGDQSIEALAWSCDKGYILCSSFNSMLYLIETSIIFDDIDNSSHQESIKKKNSVKSDSSSNNNNNSYTKDIHSDEDLNSVKSSQITKSSIETFESGDDSNNDYDTQPRKKSKYIKKLPSIDFKSKKNQEFFSDL